MRTAFGTDIGRVRQLNEDRIWVGTVPSGAVLAVVADGMGGHNAGEVASEAAVQAIEHYFRINPPDQHVHVRMEQLKMAVITANASVFGMAEKEAGFQGMGTTVSAVLADASELCIGHVGDSRVYLWSNSRLTLLTEDHTYTNMLLRTGQITEEEAEHHPRRNMLVRVVGTDPHVKVDVQSLQWHPGDLLLICSDGLNHYVRDEKIQHILGSETPFEQLAGELIALANDAGGQDNISVILLLNDTSQHSREGGA